MKSKRKIVNTLFHHRYWKWKNNNLNCNNYLKCIHIMRFSSDNNDRMNGNNDGFMDRIIAKHGSQAIIADEGYNRVKVVPYAVMANVCLGALYAWSIFNEPLTREVMDCIFLFLWRSDVDRPDIFLVRSSGTICIGLEIK